MVYDLVPCRLLLATCPSGRRQLFHILEQPSNSNWFSFYPSNNAILWHIFARAWCSFHPFHRVILNHTFSKAWYSSSHSLVQSLDWKSFFKAYTSFKKNITCTKRRRVPPHLKTKTEWHRERDKNKEHGGDGQQDGAEAKSVATGGVRWGVRWWRRSKGSCHLRFSGIRPLRGGVPPFSTKEKNLLFFTLIFR